MRVAICIITYQRPHGLERLLRSVDELTFSCTAPALEIIVVDNDPVGAAQTQIEQFAKQLNTPVLHFHQPRRGIPIARNTAVEKVSLDTDFIAFIDDDETPEPNWLNELLRVQSKNEADVVTGPVLPIFEHKIPEWMEKGRFFERPRYETGTIRDRAFTGNILVAAQVLRDMSPMFDERFSLSGGEDTHLFQRIDRAGYQIVWADEAIVYEYQPPTRTTQAWLVQRMYRSGNVAPFIALDLTRNWKTRLILLAKGLIWILLGVIVTIFGWIAGRYQRVRGLRYLAYGRGMIAGLFGHRFEEYQTTHGV